MAKTKTKLKKTRPSNSLRDLKETHTQAVLSGFARDNYTEYSLSVLEDRAIPDFRDGLLPVTRRILWAMHQKGFDSRSKYTKAAKTVGEVIGSYHPHGDQSAYGSMVGLTNKKGKIANICHGLIEGEGNWGTIASPRAAAMRYTEARLSAFADAVVFNKFYLPVIETVPNFDNTTVEPLVLPVLLPLGFLNGSFGIAPGATSYIPAFEIKTVLRVLHAAFSGEEITSKLLFSTLRATTTFGGQEDVKAFPEGRKDLFTKKKGGTLIRSVYTWDEKRRLMTYNRFAIGKFENMLVKLNNTAGVVRAEDSSSVGEAYGSLTVELKKGTEVELKKLREKIDLMMADKANYVLNFTRRSKDDTGQAKAEVRALALVDTFTLWVKWRVALEKKACAYWIVQDDKEIRRLNLLVQAVDLIDFIVQLLKNKKLKTNDEVYQAYAKKAKVEVEEARYVLSRPIISLRNLEKADLFEKIKATQKNRKELSDRRDAPKPFLKEQLKDFKDFV